MLIFNEIKYKNEAVSIFFKDETLLTTIDTAKKILKQNTTKEKFNLLIYSKFETFIYDVKCELTF